MIETIPTKADLDEMSWPDLKELGRANEVPIARRSRKLITTELVQVLKSPTSARPVAKVEEGTENWLHYPTGGRRGKGQWFASVAEHVPTTIFVYTPAGALACATYAFTNGIKMDHHKHARLFVDLMEG